MRVNNTEYPSCDSCKHKDVCKYKASIEELKKKIKVGDKDAATFDFIKFKCECKYYESQFTTTIGPLVSPYTVTYGDGNLTPTKFDYKEVTCNSESTAATLMPGTHKVQENN